ncbi:hypothetical protein SETIT_2G050000v2 [Setaria italica]|uniref:Bifunctional inhibitor/plant lipid transfer protein/seed storage helical domain-containing protein n=1 Tax=Setaria italica TaxID=4555 RepID=K3ZX66_SETIT|nr:non-specific lipid transfer protein GPI-anchored 2 [Setaria italica]RCV09694.1 hypothetical protein SETIT_2G050000v2 [Setaria italica]
MGSLNLMIIRLLAVVTTALLAAPASGQGQAGAASCTASLITSFTPCLNFLTNGGGGGSAPTQDCCRSLAELMSASTGCACLILTGNVPLGVPGVNRTLAVALPKACNSAAVPLQCRDTSAQIPAPGTGADVPSSATPATPEVEPTATAPVSQEQTRPVVLPSSGRRASVDAPATTAAFVLLLAVGAALV